MRFCGFAFFFDFLKVSLGKCCYGILHRSSEVWCAKDEQTDTIYAVKNICEATCPTKCREWNDTKCMELLWNQLSVSGAMCQVQCVKHLDFLQDLLPEIEAPSTSAVSRREFEVSDHIRLMPHPCHLVCKGSVFSVRSRKKMK